MSNFPLTKTLSALTRGAFLKFAYQKIEALDGFSVHIPRYWRQRAILLYTRRAQKVFRYYISTYDLREIFLILDDFLRNDIEEQQVTINRLGCEIKRMQDKIALRVEFSSHNFEIYRESLRMRKSACHEAIFGFVLAS